MKVARLIRRYLTLNLDGVDIWTYENNLKPGLPETSQVRRAIKKAGVVIFLLSEQYVASDAFERDTTMANKAFHEIIPMFLDKCQPSRELKRKTTTKPDEWIEICPPEGDTTTVSSGTGAGAGESSEGESGVRTTWETVLAAGMQTLQDQIAQVIRKQRGEAEEEEEPTSTEQAGETLDITVGDPLDDDPSSGERPEDFMDGEDGDKSFDTFPII